MAHNLEISTISSCFATCSPFYLRTLGEWTLVLFIYKAKVVCMSTQQNSSWTILVDFLKKKLSPIVEALRYLMRPTKSTKIGKLFFVIIMALQSNMESWKKQREITPYISVARAVTNFELYIYRLLIIVNSRSKLNLNCMHKQLKTSHQCKKKSLNFEIRQLNGCKQRLVCYSRR